MSRRPSIFGAALVAAVTASAGAQTIAGGRTEPAAAFGGAVAISNGDVLVGEPFNNIRSGLVYIYRKAGGSWTEASTLAASDGKAGDGFGSAIAVDGTTMLVGAVRSNDNRGTVYVFQRQGSSAWRETARLAGADVAAGDQFGATIALRGDLALVSAPGQAKGAGAVYVFRRTGANWAQAGKLVSPEAKDQVRFGSAIAFDGDRLLISEPGANERAGAVHLFTRDASGEYKAAGKLNVNGLQRNDVLGVSMAVSGNTLLVGANGLASTAGGIVTFTKDETGQWREHGRLFPYQGARFDNFGSAIALAGNDLLVGAPRGNDARGMVFHYSRANESSAWTSVTGITPDEAIRGDAFGATIASAGDLAAVGMTSDDYGAGSVVILERVNNAWRQTAMLKSPDERIASIMGGKVECNNGKAASFECQDFDLVSFMSVPDLGGSRGVRLNDVWGWTDPKTGKEYALVGRMDGTSFVDMSNPEKPVLVGDLPMTKGASAAAWRDMKVYKDHVYIVADGSGAHGMQVFDLARLRDVKNQPAKFEPDFTYRNINSAHNIVINEATGFAYSVGSSSGGETCGGGLHMIDVRDPKNPKFAGCFSDPQTGRASTGYSHDAQCVVYHGPDRQYHGREICLGSNETALSIADVTDKKNPKAIARASYPNVGYSHQGWFDEEQRYFYMNDELDELQGLTPKTRTIVWDLTELDDPQVVGEFMGVTSASDHNLYIRDNLMYQSNYQSGLRVIDISDRTNPKEVGFFDTVPYGTNTPGFGGSWSNYPYFKSGNVIMTSGSEGLFIVRKKAPKVVS